MATQTQYSGAPCPIKVLIVDNHIMVRAGLRMILEAQPDMTVVGEASRCVEAREVAATQRPDVVLLDLALGDESGLETIPEMRAVAPNARLVVVSSVLDVELHQVAVQLGAVGLVSKEQAPEILLRAIRRVHAGEVWLNGSLVASALSRMTRPIEARPDPEEERISSLTSRERQVIELVCAGLPNKQIGQRLNISEITVRHHLTSIFDKLGCESRLELVIYAYRNELGRAPP